MKYNRAKQGDLVEGGNAPDIKLINLNASQSGPTGATCLKRGDNVSLLQFMSSDARPLVVVAGSYT